MGIILNIIKKLSVGFIAGFIVLTISFSFCTENIKSNLLEEAKKNNFEINYKKKDRIDIPKNFKDRIDRLENEIEKCFPDLKKAIASKDILKEGNNGKFRLLFIWFAGSFKNVHDKTYIGNSKWINLLWFYAIDSMLKNSEKYFGDKFIIEIVLDKRTYDSSKDYFQYLTKKFPKNFKTTFSDDLLLFLDENFKNKNKENKRIYNLAQQSEDGNPAIASDIFRLLYIVPEFLKDKEAKQSSDLNIYSDIDTFVGPLSDWIGVSVDKSSNTWTDLYNKKFKENFGLLTALSSKCVVDSKNGLWKRGNGSDFILALKTKKKDWESIFEELVKNLDADTFKVLDHYRNRLNLTTKKYDKFIKFFKKTKTIKKKAGIQSEIISVTGPGLWSGHDGLDYPRTYSSATWTESGFHLTSRKQEDEQLKKQVLILTLINDYVFLKKAKRNKLCKHIKKLIKQTFKELKDKDLVKESIGFISNANDESLKEIVDQKREIKKK